LERVSCVRAMGDFCFVWLELSERLLLGYG